jgi:DNA-binding GntR family transcriptional regulator
MTNGQDGGHRAATAGDLRPLVEAAKQRYRTAEDRALDILRTAIERGLFRPGERLPQDHLASLLGLSRMPVRSALRQLEAEGFVSLEPHRGAVVRVVTPSEIQDLYEIRILVESFALRRVAVQASGEDLRRLEALADRIDVATSEERAVLMDEFYRRLYQTGNSARIVALVMQLRSEVTRWSSGASDQRATHRELLEALSVDDPDLAAAWLASHLRKLARRAAAHTSPEPDEVH